MKPIRVRIAGHDVAGKGGPVTDEKEVFVPAGALDLVGVRGKSDSKAGKFRILLPRTAKGQTLRLVRRAGEPLVALSEVAKVVNGNVKRPDAVGPDGKTTVGVPGDTVYLLARVLDARVEDGALRIVTSFPVPYRTRNLRESAPLRGYVDCIGAEAAPDFRPAALPSDEKRVLKLRAGQNETEIARIVVELADKVALKPRDSTENTGASIAAPLLEAGKTAVRVADAGAEKHVAPTVQQPGTTESWDSHPGGKTTGPATPPDEAKTMPKAAGVKQTDGNPTTPSGVSSAADPAQIGAAGAVPKKQAVRGSTASRGGKAIRQMIPVVVKGVRVLPEDDTRVLVEIATSGRASASVHYEHGANRLCVDIANASLNFTEPSEQEQILSHPLLTGVHVAPAPDAATPARVTLEMTRIAGFSMVTQDDKLSLELRLPRNATGALSDKLVVVDAGHGGTSTGAVGRGSDGVVYEKNVTLAMAIQLRKCLEEAGARVVMTRDRDTNVDLYERPRMSNEIGADFFISIHNDSNGSVNSASGTSTYYHMGDASSRALAICIQEAVHAVTGLPSRGALSDGVLYASGLAVLRSSKMPAALVEVAYINNNRDRRKLVNPEFQQRVAQAIADGLRNYIEGSTGASSTAVVPLEGDTPPANPEAPDTRNDKSNDKSDESRTD